MTLREALANHLEQRGLFIHEARRVLSDWEAADEAKPMIGRWDHDITEYPDTLLRVLRYGAEQQAVKWIDANRPNHWARGLLR